MCQQALPVSGESCSSIDWCVSFLQTLSLPVSNNTFSNVATPTSHTQSLTSSTSLREIVTTFNCFSASFSLTGNSCSWQSYKPWHSHREQIHNWYSHTQIPIHKRCTDLEFHLKPLPFTSQTHHTYWCVIQCSSAGWYRAVSPRW